MSEASNVKSVVDLKTGSTIQLSDDQNTAVYWIRKFLTEQASPTNQVFVLGGYAGTGKTTVIKYLVGELSRELSLRSVVTSFTGKACDVLRRKGVYASTMHSLMYDASYDSKNRTWNFYKKSKLDENPDFIIIDEASMMNIELYKDICSFRKPIICVGDPGQLPPIGDNPNIMLKQNYTLTRIHRQAAENPIIQFAHFARGRDINGFMSKKYSDTEPQLVVRLKPARDQLPMLLDTLAGFDQILVAYNNDRTYLNNLLRQHIHKPGSTELVPGERLIVLKNNKLQGVFNGMQLVVHECKSLDENLGVWWVVAHDELGARHEFNGMFPDTAIDRFGSPSMDAESKTKVNVQSLNIPTDYVLIDYAYVITVHKAQGSEWDNVCVLESWSKLWQMNTWQYTAITRAAKHLTYLRAPSKF